MSDEKLFESAVDAVVGGDMPALVALLEAHPGLVGTRSGRAHHATLLHYLAANGVEDNRQITPANAVELAHILLRAGADVDALADMYGGRCTTMNMLVSSDPPAKAGVQPALVETLLDYGAAIEGAGAGPSPLMTALAFGHLPAAEVLVKRGARVENIAAAAGLGKFDQASELFPSADAEDRHRALALAAQHGHVEIVRLLLDAGEDPNRYNPPGLHPHSTPLHQAVIAGHASVVQLLIEHGARLDLKDSIYQGTPLGWAEYGGQIAIAGLLRK
jgi:ankyrin repeat protein